MPGGVGERRQPTYPLETVWEAFAAGRFSVTRRVFNHLLLRGWKLETVRACVLALTPQDFHKSQQHVAREGIWLDIYRPVFRGERLYVKFTPLEDDRNYRVLSFCGDGESH